MIKFEGCFLCSVTGFPSFSLLSLHDVRYLILAVVAKSTTSDFRLGCLSPLKLPSTNERAQHGPDQKFIVILQLLSQEIGLGF